MSVNDKRKARLKQRLLTLQEELNAIRIRPTVHKQQQLAQLQRKIELVKGEVKALERTKPVKKAPARKTPAKSTRPKDGNAQTSPSIINKPIETITSLRSVTKQALRYVQQADSVIDTLFSTASSLHESGVLQKLLQHKGKNLSTGDVTTILSSLLNSSLGGKLLERLGGGGDEQVKQ